MTEDSFYGLAAVIVAVFAGAAILTPILALSARFALKPVMETWMRLKQSTTTDQEKIMQDRRIALLEAEVQSLQQAVHNRLDVQEFDRALAKPQTEPQPPA